MRQNKSDSSFAGPVESVSSGTPHDETSAREEAIFENSR